MELISSHRRLSLHRPQVMGILNVTPDSFSDGGQFHGRDAALTQAEQMISAGASLIDVGGESTRPGAQAVSVQEELDRVIPVIEAIRSVGDVMISVDTSKPEVMRAAVTAGADVINDVRALQEQGALAAANELDVPVCLMHMQGQPRTMQANPQYDDVVADVLVFCEQRIADCESTGIARGQIIVDPGFGFGKTLQHNLELLKNLDQFHTLGCPILVGVSRKSMLGAITGQPVENRKDASVAAAVYAALKGAHIVRVHDVQATVDALDVINAAQLGKDYIER